MLELITADDLQMRRIWEKRDWDRSATYSSRFIGVLAKGPNWLTCPPNSPLFKWC